MKNKNILIVLPEQNFNEQEFVITKTIFSRSGLHLLIASDTGDLCIGDNNLKVKADLNFYNIHEPNFSGIVFIGGLGVSEYLDNKYLHLLVNKFNNNNKLIAAICAAPVILANAGILNNIKATCFPNVNYELTKNNAIYVDQPVVISNNIITGKDYNAAEEFAFTIITAIDNWQCRMDNSFTKER